MTQHRLCRAAEKYSLNAVATVRSHNEKIESTVACKLCQRFSGVTRENLADGAYSRR